MDISRDRRPGQGRKHQTFWIASASLVLVWLLLTVLILMTVGPALAGWILATGAAGALALGMR